MDLNVDLGDGARLTLHRPDEDGAVRNADVELTDADGKRWSATVLTLDEVARLMSSWESSGECQSGAFLRVPDLIVLRDPAAEAVVRVFAELHASGEHRREMSPLHDDYRE